MINYKALTLEQLKDIFSEFHFKVEPRWHQYVSLAFTFGEQLDRVNYLHDVGTGKTITSLLTCLIWGCERILVIAPDSSFKSWETGITLSTNYTYQFITGSTPQRKAKIRENQNVSVMTYDALKTVFGGLIRGSERSQWEIDCTAFNEVWDCIIFDEIHNCKNNSLQMAICRYLSALSRHSIGLTGTPIDKSLLELFYVYLVLDGGELLGTNFWTYRNKYFYKYWYDWKPKNGTRDTILNLIKKNSIAFDRVECFDLPQTTTIPLYLTPSEEFIKIQNKILKNTTFVHNDKDYEITLHFKIQKLVQLASGFMYLGDNDVLELKDNVKITALNELLDKIDDKLIVVFKYTQERDMIVKELNRRKISHLVLDGHTEDKEEVKRKFVEDKKVKVLLLYPKCGKEGFDASVCNKMLFYSPIVSPTIIKQCKGRIDRSGQTKSCLFYDFVVNKSVETTVYKNKNKAKDVVESINEFIREYKF